MANLTEREFEKFSAYLDGQLSPDENKRMEELLQVNPQWRLALEELAATRKLLRSAPRYRAPRNFTLTPEMARSVARKPWFPVFPAFRFSAALAALSLLAVAALQVIGIGSITTASQIAMAPAAPAMEAAPMDLARETLSADTEKSVGEEPAYTFEWSEPEGFGGGDGTGGVQAPPVVNDTLKGAAQSAPSGGIVTYGQQPQPEFAYGMGGGGGGGAPELSFSLPPNAVASGEEPAQAQEVEQPAEPPQAAEPAPDNSARAGVENSGPILGLPAPGEGGQIIASSGPSAIDPGQAAETNASGNQAGFPPLRIAQIGFGAIALLAIAAALVFRARRL